MLNPLILPHSESGSSCVKPLARLARAANLC
jgi:hypothetical protein